ncbi:MAG: hypothetical protein MI807_04035 [Verrucomicrobiales bacterium]|nr:hypothetical protein [Verrucomicrobiales bacterium]
MNLSRFASDPKTAQNQISRWFHFFATSCHRRGENSIRRIAFPQPRFVKAGAISPDSRPLLWAAAEQVRSANLEALHHTDKELRRRLASLTKPLEGAPSATDRAFLVDRAKVAPEAAMEALALAHGASVTSLFLAGERHERLALVIEHVAELAELAAEEGTRSVGEKALASGKSKLPERLEGGEPHPMIWLGHHLIRRWVTIHQVYFATMSAAALAMRLARAALEAGHEERGLIFTGVAEALLRDGVELFSLTPTGLRYRLFLRPYMASIAPGLSGGEGTEHQVFIQDYRRLISFDSDRPCVMAALGTLRGSYALAFDHHRTVCAHAVGQQNGSLKNPDHGAPEVLGKLKASRTSRCPMHRFLNLFTSQSK